MSFSSRKPDWHGTKGKAHESTDRRGSDPKHHGSTERRGSELVTHFLEAPQKWDGTRRDSGIGAFLSGFSGRPGARATHVVEKGPKLLLEAPPLHTLAMLARPHPLHVRVVTGFLSIMGYEEPVLLVRNLSRLWSRYEYSWLQISQ